MGSNEGYAAAVKFATRIHSGDKSVGDDVKRFVEGLSDGNTLSFFKYVLENRLGMWDGKGGIGRAHNVNIELPWRGRKIGDKWVQAQSVEVPLAKTGRFLKEEKHTFSTVSYSDDKTTTYIEFYHQIEGSASLGIEIFKIKGGLAYKVGTKSARRDSKSWGVKQSSTRSRSFIVTKYERNVLNVFRTVERTLVGNDSHTHVAHIHNVGVIKTIAVLEKNDVYEIAWAQSKQVDRYARTYDDVLEVLDTKKNEFLWDVIKKRM